MRAIRHKTNDTTQEGNDLPVADPSLGFILGLVHRSRHIHTALKTLLNRPAAPTLRILLVDADRHVLENLSQSLGRVAASNTQFGLPPFPISISCATSVEEAQTLLRDSLRLRCFFAIAFVNLCNGVAADYLQQAEEKAMATGEATIFVGYKTRPIDGLKLSELYSAFGVIDVLPDLSDRSLRTALHNWMPRSCSFWGWPPISATSGGKGLPPAWSPPLVRSSGMRRVSSSGQVGQAPDACVMPFDLEGCNMESMCISAPQLSAPYYQYGRMPPAPAYSHLNSTIRVLLVTSCLRSSATLQYYCDSLDIWLDVELTGENAMKRLSRSPGKSDEMCEEMEVIPCSRSGVSVGERVERTYDLVVVEPDLPGMSGYALCSWYKDCASCSNKVPATKFVALAEEPDTEACGAFGLDYCVAKPLTAICFARLLMMWLNS